MNKSRLTAFARERMVKDAGAYYDDSEPPELEILDEHDRAIEFLAHRYVYNFAQSGSDWADHYILVGYADKATGEIVIEPHYTHLTERESDDYDKVDALARARTLRVTGKARCSRCQSTNIVVWEAFFGWVKYACNACGLQATE